MTADLRIAQTGLLHTFNALENGLAANCQLCREGQAAFQWSKQQDERLLRHGILVCRTCAGMIMLVGKENY